MDVLFEGDILRFGSADLKRFDGLLEENVLGFCDIDPKRTTMEIDYSAEEFFSVRAKVARKSEEAKQREENLDQVLQIILVLTEELKEMRWK